MDAEEKLAQKRQMISWIVQRVHQSTFEGDPIHGDDAEDVVLAAYFLGRLDEVLHMEEQPDAFYGCDLPEMLMKAKEEPVIEVDPEVIKRFDENTKWLKDLKPFLAQ